MSSEGTPLIVAGMHRSGTSFTTARLQDRGMHLGEDLLEARAGNQHGHFESKAVMDFQIELLNELRPGYAEQFGHLSSLIGEPLDYRIGPDHRERALKVLREIRSDGVWGWKDPRSCLFLDLWLDLLPEARILVLYRHPLEVHDSLCRRGGDPEMWLDFDEARSVSAYRIYNEALLSSMESHPHRRVVINAPGAILDREKMDQLSSEGLDLALRPIENENFDPKSFSPLILTASLRELFARYFPKAHEVFEKFDQQADIRQPVPDPNDPEVQAVEKSVEALTRYLDGLPAAPDASTLLRLMLQSATAHGERPFSESLGKMRRILDERFGWFRGVKSSMAEQEALRERLEADAVEAKEWAQRTVAQVEENQKWAEDNKQWAEDTEKLLAETTGWRDDMEGWAKREEERAVKAEAEAARGWKECEEAVAKLETAEARVAELEELVEVKRPLIEMKEEARQLREGRAVLEDHSYRLRVDVEKMRRHPVIRFLAKFGVFGRAGD